MAMRVDPLPLTEDDPVWRAVLAAPMGPPASEEEAAAFEALLADVRAGRRGVDHDAVRATIEEMRAEQGDAPEP